MSMTETERLDYLVEHLEGGKSAAFAEKIGVRRDVISRIRAGSLRLSRRYDAILKAYPEVDRNWLLTGEGYPGDLSARSARDHYMKIIEEKDRTINALARELELQQRVIETLTEHGTGSRGKSTQKG